MNKLSIQLTNYLDLLIDKKIDNITKCPICISGISNILYEINEELKANYQGKSIQRFLKEKSLYGIYHWKKNWYPVPISKLKKYLELWRVICKKSDIEFDKLYNEIYEKADYFKAFKSSVNIKIIKSLDWRLAYILGVIYADGALRDIWLTKRKEGRFRFEITITDESESNLQSIVALLNEIFGIKTNVKKVYDGKWYRVLFQSMILHRILNKIFEMPMGYKKGRLRIPEVIKKAPFEIKKYFLIGFFDGDGMCSRLNQNERFTPTVSVSQSSMEILQDLNEILKVKGLRFRLTKSKRQNYVWYRLQTKDKKQIRKFQEEFGFRYHNKSKRLKELVSGFESKATIS